MSDEPGVIWLPNNNYFSNRNGQKPKFVILHGTAGGSSAVGIANYFKSTENGNNPVSSHYVVDQHGVVVQCIAEVDGAYGNGILSAGHDTWWSTAINPNNITISIEHVKPDVHNETPLTPAQQAASFKLIQHICERHGIPKRRADANGGITGHYSIDPVSRSQCPGEYPWAALFAYLATTEIHVPTHPPVPAPEPPTQPLPAIVPVRTSTPPPNKGVPTMTQTSSSQVLVHGVPLVPAYAIGKSEARDAAACLASLAAFARPNHWPNLSTLASDIYTAYAGKDTSDNATPLTREQVLDWCSANGIGTFVLAGISTLEELRAEMAAMNKSGIPVLLFLGDGSKLLTYDGKPLHPYQTEPRSHAIIRLGADSVRPITFILDPSAPCPPLPCPIPASWDSITQSTVLSAIGIMPPKVEAPPSGFRFVANGTEQAWPEIKPDASLVVAELRDKVRQEREKALAAEDAKFLETLQALGWKGE